jgi:hypothetical protein
MLFLFFFAFQLPPFWPLTLLVAVGALLLVSLIILVYVLHGHRLIVQGMRRLLSQVPPAAGHPLPVQPTYPTVQPTSHPKSILRPTVSFNSSPPTVTFGTSRPSGPYISPHFVTGSGLQRRHSMSESMTL